jgi:hypothetical protein
LWERRKFLWEATPMFHDPIVKEVRQVRQRIAKKDGNLKTTIARLRREEKETPWPPKSAARGRKS